MAFRQGADAVNVFVIQVKRRSNIMKSFLYGFLQMWNNWSALSSGNPRKILNRGMRLGLGKVSGRMLRGIGRNWKF